MHPILAWLRRYALFIVLLGLMAHFGYRAHVNSSRLSAICAAFSGADPLIDRAIPGDSPWRMEIDERRQAISTICDTHLSEADYPEKPELRR